MTQSETSELKTSKFWNAGIAGITIVSTILASLLLVELWPAQSSQRRLDRSAPLTIDYGTYHCGYEGVIRLSQRGRAIISLGDPADVIEGIVGPPCDIQDDGIKGPIVSWKHGADAVTVVCNGSRVVLIEVSRGP